MTKLVGVRLAGDVFAAAVIFDDGVFVEGINDSKKLTEKKREALFDEIISKARAYCIASASVEEIERLNITSGGFPCDWSLGLQPLSV